MEEKQSHFLRLLFAVYGRKQSIPNRSACKGSQRRPCLKEEECKTERKTLHLPIDTIKALEKLAAKNGTDLSKEIRHAIDAYLDVSVTAENINMIHGASGQGK